MAAITITDYLYRRAPRGARELKFYMAVGDNMKMSCPVRGGRVDIYNEVLNVAAHTIVLRTSGFTGRRG